MLALRIFPVSHPTSIVRADELNFCVRDGNRWTLIAINTNFKIYPENRTLEKDGSLRRRVLSLLFRIVGQALGLLVSVS